MGLQHVVMRTACACAAFGRGPTFWEALRYL